MAYLKRYNLKELQKTLNQLIEKNIKFINIDDLLFEIDFDPLDINTFYIKYIKHRLRYEREDLLRR
jgi:hypothetical protein